ncbi:MAG: hypothetical protein KDE26_12415 [Bacteroidetes bacterium]|nr:hypothetical protein [Bacteroidota bacterium]MCB0844051.1 hypothetical protein [Bacteroidota bacterium]
MIKTNSFRLPILFAFLFIFSSSKGQIDTLFRPNPSFTANDRLVTTTVFHWYGSMGGQLSGPWVPIEGRQNWTGTHIWWKSQVKQMMAANIDIIYVHLMNQTEPVRRNLFKALYEMRSEGYDVPKVGPFLDAPITWYMQPKVDLATQAGKDDIANQYIRFFNQFFDENPDPYASDYLARMAGRPMLNTWHVFLNMDHVDSLKRSDLEGRLATALGTNFPVFNNGIHMVTTALNVPVFSFADEKVPQFEINQYFYPIDFNNIKTVQLKGGYWDQNIRNPGDFLPRDGGIHFKNAWDQVDTTFNRVYVESWNEYDEGTGIYATMTDTNFIKPGSGNTNTDLWSVNDDPYEYIHTTAEGASRWNTKPEFDAIVLRHNIPAKMNKKASQTVTVTLRNEGNALWSQTDGFALKQVDTDPVLFMQSVGSIDDSMHDIPTFGGVFRGRPVSFDLSIQAPDSTGVFETHWQMVRNDTAFGEILTAQIEVTESTAIEETADWLDFESIAPNPFSESTEISFHLLRKVENMELKILDLMGREITVLASGSFLPGKHTFVWRGEGLSSGLYLCRLETDAYYSTRKIWLNK